MANPLTFCPFLALFPKMKKGKKWTKNDPLTRPFLAQFKKNGQKVEALFSILGLFFKHEKTTENGRKLGLILLFCIYWADAFTLDWITFVVPISG